MNVQLLEPMRYRGFEYGIGKKLSVSDALGIEWLRMGKAREIDDSEPAHAVLEVQNVVQEVSGRYATD